MSKTNYEVDANGAKKDTKQGGNAATAINSNAFRERESIGKLMRKYSIPYIISLLVAALYNIVDQIFIANASYLGSYGNAANTVVFWLTVIALAVMIGDGCCAYVSICLGAQNQKNAHRGIGNAIILCVAASLVLTAIYFALQNPVLTAFGGIVNEETFANSKEYFLYITMGVPFYMFGQAMNPIIRSDGSPRFAMISTLVGAVVNIILDPIFGQTQYAQIPIVGYNIGAGRKDRAAKLFTYLLTGEAAVGAVALLIAEFLPGQLIQIFGAANESSHWKKRCYRHFFP